MFEDDHLRRIRGALHKGSESILEAGTACYDADASLYADQLRHLIKELGFSRSTFSKYVAIGADKRLHDPRIAPRLPAKFSVIYELTQLDDDEFRDVEGGLLRQNLKREELIRWRTQRRNGFAVPPRWLQRAATASTTPVEYKVAAGLSNEAATENSRGKCTLTIDATRLGAGQHVQLFTELRSIAAEYSLTVEASPEFLAMCTAEAA